MINDAMGLKTGLVGVCEIKKKKMNESYYWKPKSVVDAQPLGENVHWDDTNAHMG